jgi:hypothetical protein
MDLGERLTSAPEAVGSKGFMFGVGLTVSF